MAQIWDSLGPTCPPIHLTTIYLHMCLPIYLLTNFPRHPFISKCLFTHLPINLPILSTHIQTHTHTHTHAHLPTDPPTHPTYSHICLSISPPAHVPASKSIYLLFHSFITHRYIIHLPSFTLSHPSIYSLTHSLPTPIQLSTITPTWPPPTPTHPSTQTEN